MKKALLLLFLILILVNNIYSDILMTPYLQALNDTSVVIMVECNSKDLPNVNYSKEKINLNNLENASFFIKTDYTRPTFMHRIILNNLAPDTKYYYKVNHGNSHSEVFSFKTLNPKAKNLRIAVYGDNRSNPKMFSKITDLVIKNDPDFILLTGDLSYNNSYVAFKDEFFTESNQKLLANYCFFNATGNHEGWSNNTKAFVEPPKSNSNTSEYYSFEFSDYHFLVLNQYSNYKKDSPQWSFASNDLKNSKAKFKFVTMHKPGYCAGGHNEDKNTIEMIKQIFVPNKVDMLFAGHSHFYQRNFVDGIYHFVLGGAGAPLYDPNIASYTQKSIKSYHYSIFEIKDNKMILTVYDSENKIIDKLEVQK